MEQMSTDVESDDGSNTSIFRSHSFDQILRLGKKCEKFNPVISGPRQASRGEGSIRTVGKYKLNETVIDSMTFLGLLPKDYKI